VALSLGYDCGLLSLSAFTGADLDSILQHCGEVARVLPLFGFYLQPAVGGRFLPYAFWRRFFEVERVVAVKIAPFNRYHTLDVVRALSDSGRSAEITLYTGNDDHIVGDLLTTFSLGGAGDDRRIQIAGGLLGHWAVWTRAAVKILETCKAARASSDIPAHLLTLGAQVTDCNAAFFDVAHDFAGCIAGIHEVLRRQGLLAGNWCLDPDEALSRGQVQEIDRVCASYPMLNDDTFVAERLDEWLS
jgi:dihydrodipicolinate synthase/N-acetylneuraminate lyase